MIDSDVPKMKLSLEGATINLFSKLIQLVILICICLPGLILTSPAQIVLNYMTEKHRRDATKNSTVKLTGIDVIARYNALPTLIIYGRCLCLINNSAIK